MTDSSPRVEPFVAGDLEIVTLVATRFALDGGAMFGVVPKTLWSREHAADAQNRIPLVARVMVVSNRRVGYRALIDAGLGDAWTPRERQQYAIEPTPLTASLADAGVDPESITDVVLTHLHWDHAGGIVTGEPSAPAPSLPRARIHIGREHADYARVAAPKDRGSFRPGEMALAAHANSIAPGEILPGLWCWESNGHTRGLLVIEARAEGVRVVFPADLLPTRAHVKPAWGMAYDNHPLTIIDEKDLMLGRAAADRAILVLEHDPGVAAIRVRESGGRTLVEPAAALRDRSLNHPG